MRNSRLPPMSGLMPSSSPRNTPPSAARAAPVIHTRRMIFAVSMPVAEARSPLSLTARVALPSRVRCSTRATVISTSEREDGDRQVPRRDRDRPEVPGDLAVVGREEPEVAAELEQVDVAQEDAEADRDDHLRHQAHAAAAEGREETGVEHEPEQAAEGDGDHRGDRQRQPDRLAEQVRHHRAERHELAVGEVRQAGRPEDQRQADRRDGEDQAEPDAVDRALGELLEERQRLP